MNSPGNTSPEPGGPPPAHGDQHPRGSVPPAEGAPHPIRRTRTAAVWLALGLSLLLLIVVLVFVLQNLVSVSTSFFTARWTVPLGVDLLLAAVFGGVITFLLGGARMLQLRRAARHIAGNRRRGR